MPDSRRGVSLMALAVGILNPTFHGNPMITDSGREPDTEQPAEPAPEQSATPAFAWDTPGAGWDEGRWTGEVPEVEQ